MPGRVIWRTTRGAPGRTKKSSWTAPRLPTPGGRGWTTSRAPVALDRNELGALLVAAGLGPPPGHALISLLALNGLRVPEATGAGIEHLGLERGHRTLTMGTDMLGLTLTKLPDDHAQIGPIWRAANSTAETTVHAE